MLGAGPVASAGIHDPVRGPPRGFPARRLEPRHPQPPAELGLTVQRMPACGRETDLVAGRRERVFLIRSRSLAFTWRPRQTKGASARLPSMTLASEPADSLQRARAYLFLTLTTLFWAGNAVAGRIAVGEISPMLLIAFRWFGTVALLVAIGGAQLRRDWPVLRRRLRYLAAMGVVGFTAFNALFYLAAHETTAVNIGILQGAMPVLVLVGSVALFRTRLGVLQVSGVAITMAGVVLVVSRGNLAVLAALDVNHGDFLMLVASLLYAAYALGLRNRPQVTPLSVLTVISAAAAIGTAPLAVAEGLMGLTIWPGFDGWTIVAYVTIFPSVMAQLFFIKGVSLIGPARAGVFINLVPVFAAVLGVAILGEPFRWYHLGALVLVLSGIWLAERRAI